MTFQTIFETFQTLPNGTDAYKQIKNQCEQAIINAENPLEHCALLLVYGFTKNYVLLYEDQPVTPDFSNKVKAQLTHYMQEISTALATEDAASILTALNHISKQYIDSSRIF
ncbi:hypothetical protein LF296_14105 [Acinetobacter vivianii]|jgi:hypothetical protein|uniref:Uncharacterized protein n=1 Tax=Acinetobacter vivianii TaxID=1776742 RepID=N9NI57_9GAMM|nr:MULTISPECIES: hypothetical protein [Acinetobacter]ENX20769.1 hypothetical protein F892_02795 [Acinetobacter vivianii]KHF78752.1 hypothetical protein PJ15_2816 [Acinetobacter sp. neg1]MBJ8483659.1 hypothetical protein [Acinetobacter vivianii]MEB6668343.1 hypothetical protein [Acinetobacter vivianii]OEC85084.1 hypothetical protein A9Z07_01455 [Acinetobacter sp. YK3]